jgi:ribosomal protein S27E
MSVRDNTRPVQDTVRYGTAAYMPCGDCGEGAVVWNEDESVSECFRCGSVYEGEL